jgi:hypothetical protein
MQIVDGPEENSFTEPFFQNVVQARSSALGPIFLQKTEHDARIVRLTGGEALHGLTTHRKAKHITRALSFIFHKSMIDLPHDFDGSGTGPSHRAHLWRNSTSFAVTLFQPLPTGSGFPTTIDTMEDLPIWLLPKNPARAQIRASATSRSPSVCAVQASVSMQSSTDFVTHRRGRATDTVNTHFALPTNSRNGKGGASGGGEPFSWGGGLTTYMHYLNVTQQIVSSKKATTIATLLCHTFERLASGDQFLSEPPELLYLRSLFPAHTRKINVQNPGTDELASMEVVENS